MNLVKMLATQAQNQWGNDGFHSGDALNIVNFRALSKIAWSVRVRYPNGKSSLL